MIQGMDYSARDVALTLIDQGVQPVQDDELRDYDLAFSRPDTEGRMIATVTRAALRELGIALASPDAKVLDTRQADFLIASLGAAGTPVRAAVYEKTPEPIVTIAHLMSGVQYDLSHALRHAEALKTAKPGEVAFHQKHIEIHAKGAADHADRLALALRHTYPAIGRELDQLLKVSNLTNENKA